MKRRRLRVSVCTLAEIFTHALQFRVSSCMSVMVSGRRKNQGYYELHPEDDNRQ